MTTADVPRLQQALVDRLRREGALHSPAVEQAFLAVPRHLFLPDEPVEKAYSDVAIAVKQDEQGRWTSSSSQPAMMAIMLEQLDLQPGMRVLEIGAGTGFNAALMAHLVGSQGRVVSVDIQADLVEAAQQRLAAAGFDHVMVICGDGGYGYPEAAPYDRIILTVASPVITPAWWEQLADGGRLVLPFEIFGSQKSTAFVRRGQVMESVSISDCGFMMLQGAYAPEDTDRIPLGPDPQVYLTGVKTIPLPPHLLYACLNGSWENWATGVRVSVFELITGLRTWLAVHFPAGQLASLNAEGQRTEPGVIPPLISVRRGKDWRLMQTLAALSERGAAALACPPGQAAPFRDLGQQSPEAARSWEEPFEIFIRKMSADADLARRLWHLIRAWEAAGRPDSSRMRIRAAPAGSEIAAEEGEHQVDKPWTKIFVRFN